MGLDVGLGVPGVFVGKVVAAGVGIGTFVGTVMGAGVGILVVEGMTEGV